VTALHAFRRRLSRRYFEPVNILCVGTSTTFGTGASQVESGFVPRLGQALRQRYGFTGGCHYLPTHSGWTRNAAGNSDLDFGQGSMTLTTGSYLERAMTCTGFRVLFKRGTAAGAFSVSIDGGTAQTISVQAGVSVTFDGVWDSAPLTRGQHTIRITGTTGTAEIGGVYAFDGDESFGIRTWNGGRPGVTTAVWAPTAIGAPSHWVRAGSLDPALLVMTVSTNDFNTQVDPAVFKANVKSSIEYFRLACRKSPSVLLVHPFLRPGAGSPPYSWDSYKAKLDEIAAELPDVGVLDVGQHWPVDQVADEDDLLSVDDLHPTDAGHAWLADIVAEHLVGLPSAPSSLGDVITAPDPGAVTGLVSAWRASDLPQVDGAAVSSWTPYAGSATAPLVQAVTGKQPVLALNQVGGKAAVKFRQPTSPYSTSGPFLTTPAWLSTAETVSVVVVARLDRNYGNVFSGVSSAALSMLILGGDMSMGMMAGTSTNGAYVTTGRNRWAVYVAVFNKTESKFWQTGWPVQSVTIPDHAADGLSGLTLGANYMGGNTANMDVAELMVFDRALTDTEAQGCLDVLARRYGIDRVGRTSV